jgi:hypothetical protein
MRTAIRAGVLGATALTALLTLGAAPALAAPAATIAMPTCCAGDTIDYGGSVYALAQQPPGPGPERPTLVRINPANNTITGSLDLLNGTSSGNALDASPMAAANGSIWVVAYFENVVLRIDPAAMSVVAQIPVGRSPSSIVSDGHALWVTLNNDRSVARLDPVTNTVTRRVKVGRQDGTDGPWQAAFDGTQLLVSLPGSGRVARIDVHTFGVTYDNVGFDAASCAHLLPVPGGYWLDDTECSPFYYRWDVSSASITVQLDPTTRHRHDWGATVAGGALYTGEFLCARTCTQGFLVKRDLVTGAEIGEQRAGSEADLPHFAAGSVWVGDFTNGTLQRLAAF